MTWIVNDLRLTVGVNNPCDVHGLVMSHVTPLYVTKVETLKFHEFLMVSLHFFLYNRHNVPCSNKLKAQINVYLSRKMQKT